jgi:DNA-binding transcriptional MerR regulator
MRIGDAAARAAVSRDALRYYERHGLLPRCPRTTSGYREYSDAIVDRVRFVRNALRFGFSVKQIAAFQRSRDAGRPPCREVRAAGERILSAIDRQIEELTAARADVQRTLVEWDRRLGATPPGRAAHLLEAIASRATARRAPSAAPRCRSSSS